MTIILNQFYVRGRYCAHPITLEKYTDGGGDEYRAYVFHKNAKGDWALAHSNISIHPNWFTGVELVTDESLIKILKMLML